MERRAGALRELSEPCAMSRQGCSKHLAVLEEAVDVGVPVPNGGRSDLAPAVRYGAGVEDAALERLVVVGTSCSGKTTLARALAARLGCRAVELDALHWLPEWVERDRTEFRTMVAGMVAADRWVVDGQYSFVRDIVWPRATAVVWLDFPFHVVMARALKRTLRRVLLREQLFSGNRETLFRSFLTRDSILWWVVRTHRRNRRLYEGLRDQQAFPHLTWVRLATPAEAERFLAGLPGRAAAPAGATRA